jgi:hypothetical protein
VTSNPAESTRKVTLEFLLGMTGLQTPRVHLSGPDAPLSLAVPFVRSKECHSSRQLPWDSTPPLEQFLHADMVQTGSGTTSHEMDFSLLPSPAWASGPPLDVFESPIIKRLLYDPSLACPLGHTAVDPHSAGNYRQRFGVVRRYTCSICDDTYSELIKPRHRVDGAILVLHYFGRVSAHRSPYVLTHVAKALNAYPGLKEAPVRIKVKDRKSPELLVSLSTVKRRIAEYSKIAANVTPDRITRLYRPKLSGFFGLDSKYVPVRGVGCACFIAHDLYKNDVPSALQTDHNDPEESLSNWRKFMRQFRQTVEGSGNQIKQVVMDDREQAWEAKKLELPKRIIATLDDQHVLQDIEQKKLPQKVRSNKVSGFVAELEYALRRSRTKKEEIAVLQHVRGSRDYWLQGEIQTVQERIDSAIAKLTDKNIERLISHWDLVTHGNALHPRTTNPTEGAPIGALNDSLDSISSFQSPELVPGQMNLLLLVYRLMPSSKTGKSTLQNCGVNKTLDDLMNILLAFDPNSPIQ